MILSVEQSHQEGPLQQDGHDWLVAEFFPRLRPLLLAGIVRGLQAGGNDPRQLLYPTAGLPWFVDDRRTPAMAMLRRDNVPPGHVLLSVPADQLWLNDDLHDQPATFVLCAATQAGHDHLGRPIIGPPPWLAVIDVQAVTSSWRRQQVDAEHRRQVNEAEARRLAEENKPLEIGNAEKLAALEQQLVAARAAV
jgi:hypothetical protein